MYFRGADVHVWSQFFSGDCMQMLIWHVGLCTIWPEQRRVFYFKTEKKGHLSLRNGALLGCLIFFFFFGSKCPTATPSQWPSMTVLLTMSMAHLQPALVEGVGGPVLAPLPPPPSGPRWQSYLPCLWHTFNLPLVEGVGGPVLAPLPPPPSGPRWQSYLPCLWHTFNLPSLKE